VSGSDSQLHEYLGPRATSGVQGTVQIPDANREPYFENRLRINCTRVGDTRTKNLVVTRYRKNVCRQDSREPHSIYTPHKKRGPQALAPLRVQPSSTGARSRRISASREPPPKSIGKADAADVKSRAGKTTDGIARSKRSSQQGRTPAGCERAQSGGALRMIWTNKRALPYRLGRAKFSELPPLPGNGRHPAGSLS